VWFSLFVLSALGAVADRFILGALGRDWIRAAAMVGPLLIWGAVQFPSWFGDRLQQAAGRPELQALMIAGEQILRIFLMFMLVRRFQLAGLMVAYLIALPAKWIVAWLLNWKLILKPKIYLWQGLAAPLLAGAINYLVIRLVSGLIWQGDMATSLLIFFLALLPSLPFYSFLAALFGGWDDQGVQELKRAADMSSLAKPIAYLVYKGTVLGARLSPIHGRFPITLYDEARAEAKGLMAEKVRLA
jgi:O-antigen/teichoic acid export membrane protein